MQPRRWLFHPHTTLGILIAGLASIGAMCASLATALAPLAATPGLQAIAPRVIGIVTVFGAVSAVCMALAAVGRSIAPIIDKGPDSGESAQPPKAD